MKRTLALATAFLATTSLANAQPPRDGEGRPDRPPRPNPLMMIFDIDQDGKLSKDEIAKAADSLGKLDRDGNGTIEPSELPQPPRPQFGGRGPGQGRPGQGGQGGRGNFGERLMQLDKNGDGKLSKDELPERFPAQMFDRLDEDGDGAVTKEEIAKMAERFRQGRPGQGRPGEGRPGEGRPRRPGGEDGGRRPRRPEGDGEGRPRRPERPDA